MEGFVHSMETFGLVDGPGVRFVVFLQGCRMRCRYCHNPETWKLEGGTPWTADKLFSHVYRYKSYWNKKGQPNGGITVSGGEPLLQIDFVTEFFKKASEKGKMKDTMERAKLESELKDIQRLVDRIPPEVLAELKRQQRHTRER